MKKAQYLKEVYANHATHLQTSQLKKAIERTEEELEKNIKRLDKILQKAR